MTGLASPRGRSVDGVGPGQSRPPLDLVRFPLRDFFLSPFLLPVGRIHPTNLCSALEPPIDPASRRAAREGARYGSRDPSLDVGDIQLMVAQDVLGSGTNITRMEHFTTTDVLVEVNTSGEETKYGLEPAETVDAIEEMADLDTEVTPDFTVLREKRRPAGLGPTWRLPRPRPPWTARRWPGPRPQPRRSAPRRWLPQGPHQPRLLLSCRLTALTRPAGGWWWSIVISSGSSSRCCSC